jgi:hypothetical protein
MYRFTLLVIITISSLIIFGCNSEKAPEAGAASQELTQQESSLEPLVATGMLMDMKNVFDNGLGTAYIKAAITTNRNDVAASDSVVASLIERLGVWQRLYPNKRIVTWTTVERMHVETYQREAGGTVGLLIHYDEQTK